METSQLDRMPNRYIPVRVRRSLRREVNWGCPASDCGSPFLTYHHFAPPFRAFNESTAHDPKGMIALCMAHAAQADGGVFTDSQLKELKMSPFLTGDLVAGRNQWLRYNTLLRCGSNIFLNIKRLLTVCNKPMIWFNRNSDGYLELSMNITDNDGNPLFVMENNDWLVSGPLNDLEAKPRGRDIVIKSRQSGFWINLGFHDEDIDALRTEIEERAVERAVERARASATSHNETLNQLRVRLPNSLKHLLEDTVFDESAVREDAWAPIAKTIGDGSILGITFEGHLPSPVEVLSTSDELRIGGMVMTGTIGIGSVSVLAFGCPDG